MKRLWKMVLEYIIFYFFPNLYLRATVRFSSLVNLVKKMFYFIFWRVRFSNLTISTRTMFRPFLTDARSSPSKLTNESSTQTQKGSTTFTRTTTSTTWRESMTPSSALSVLKEESLLLNNIQPNFSTKDLYLFCHH